MEPFRRLSGTTGDGAASHACHCRGEPVESDEDLMRSWQRGCQQPLDEIVARYHTPIYNYLFRLTCQHALAEDLTL